MGGGITLPITESMALTVSYNDLLWGERVDDAHTFSIGLDWNIRLFGGFGSGLLIDDE